MCHSSGHFGCINEQKVKGTWPLWDFFWWEEAEINNTHSTSVNCVAVKSGCHNGNKKKQSDGDETRAGQRRSALR